MKSGSRYVICQWAHNWQATEFSFFFLIFVFLRKCSHRPRFVIQTSCEPWTKPRVKVSMGESESQKKTKHCQMWKGARNSTSTPQQMQNHAACESCTVMMVSCDDLSDVQIRSTDAFVSRHSRLFCSYNEMCHNDHSPFPIMERDLGTRICWGPDRMRVLPYSTLLDIFYIPPRLHRRDNERIRELG